MRTLWTRAPWHRTKPKTPSTSACCFACSIGRHTVCARLVDMTCECGCGTTLASATARRGA